METAPIQVNDPLYVNLASQIAALNSHTHNSSDSQQLYPKWFHGWPLSTQTPTNNAEEGSIIFYNSSTRKLYVMIGQSWRSIQFDFTSSLTPWGSGLDGALTFDGSTTILGIVPSANVYILARDIFATTLIVNNGVTIKTNGFKIYAATSLSISGTITVAGGNGGAGGAGQTTSSSGARGTGGTAGSAGIGISSGTIKEPGNGIIGTTGCNAGVIAINTKNGGNGVAETNCILSNSGVAGGNSGTGFVNPSTGSSDNHSTAGSGGVATRTESPHSAFIDILLVNNLGGIGCNPSAGSGAGGGSGSGINSADSEAGGGGGGGSGAPGGILSLASPSITVTVSGTVTAVGGNGGNGGDGGTASGAGLGGSNYGGGGGGGGGGGNGGLILLLTPTYTNNGTVTAAAGNGGSGGAGNTSGANGSSGSSGVSGVVQQISP